MPEPANEGLQPLSDINKLVHEPARLLILGTLKAVDSADFLFLSRQTGLTHGNLSSHMRKLEGAGYVEISKEFVDKIPRTLLRITGSGRQALQDYTQSMAKVIDSLGT